MGVVISKPAINLREQLTELKAQQGYEERQFHFDNLVTNGTFDTDTDWTKGTGWTISGGTATHNGGFGGILQDVTTAVGAVYSISFDASYTSGGGLEFWVGGQLLNTSTATETFTLTVVASSVSTEIKFITGSGVWDIDNVSVYEVDPNDSNKVIHTMPKGWKPLHVFEDGALQREGSAYDYTVEYNGFNYIVKETVAPVAPYSTTVIGVRA